MASLNKVMLIGNVGRAAELRYTARAVAQAGFSLAVNNRRKNQTGEWEDQTEWFNVVLFGDQAEKLAQYITKGKSLFIEGRLHTRNWDDDQGQKHQRVEVIAAHVVLLEKREGGAAGPSLSQSPSSDFDDDLPFE